MYLLLASNCLACLTVLLCPTMWSEFHIDLRYVLEKLIPNMRKMSENCFSVMSKKLDDVKYYHLNRTQLKKRFNAPKPKAHTRLYEASCAVMEHTNDIIEKSQIIFRNLESVNFVFIFCIEGV